jgi:hypothetical protein
LANATIGTHLENKKRDQKKDTKKDKKKDKKKYKKKGEEKEEEDDDDELMFGWAKVPLSFNQLLYIALDARLDFEIARSYWKLKATIAILIVLTLMFIRWMIVDVWLCESYCYSIG